MIPFFLMLALDTAPAVAGEVRVLSLSEAVALAQRDAPAVIHANGQSQAAASAMRSARGAFIPSLSLSASADRQIPSRAGQTRIVSGQVQTFSSKPWSYSAGLSTSLALFEGGQRFFQLQSARAQVDAAGTGLTQQRDLAALAAKQQYFAVLSALEFQAAAQTQLGQAREQLAMSVLHLKARTVTRSDSLRSEILVHNATSAVTQAQTDLAQANVSLQRVVGVPYAVTAAADVPEGDSTLALSRAALGDLVAQAPAVVQADAAVRQARAALRITWTGYLPSLTASYGRSGSGASDGFDVSGSGFAYSGALRLALSLPVFDQFQRENRVVLARTALVDAEASARDARLEVLESLTRSYGAFGAAAERVSLQAATLAAAQEDLRERQEQYNAGTTSLLDVMTSRTALDQARRDEIAARYERRLAKAELEALLGRSL
jgi:outer membrane protein